jgi:hypothetical protein
VRDDRWEASLTGTAPASVLWDGEPGRYVPDVQFSPVWDALPNEHGATGRTARIGTSAPKPLSTHGSLAPLDMANTMVLAGASIRGGRAFESPASPADVAPTVLHLLGLPAGTQMQGRALMEAIGGDAPAATTESLLEGGWGQLVRRRCDGAAYVGIA